VNLFDSLAVMHGLDLTKPEDIARFGAVVVSAMEAVRGQPNVLHGWRIQSMFAYVAASLGAVDVVKEEDAGRLIARPINLRVPDYRLVLQSGKRGFRRGEELPQAVTVSTIQPARVRSRWTE
jgi:hypothetical protein